MRKALFFSLPSTSVNHTLLPVINSLSLEYDVIMYNRSSFLIEKNHDFEFRSYPDSYQGYDPTAFQPGISYFEFAEVLLDTTISIIDFLIREAQKEKPAFIVHSHLALWGKIVASHLKIPAVSLLSTFVLDSRIMRPYLNGEKKQAINFSKVDHAISFYRKAQTLFDRLDIQESPDIWDAYVNRGQLNLSFILEEFQPKRELLNDSFYFLGSTRLKRSNKQPQLLIYISLGTVFNKDSEFYDICFDVIRSMPFKAIVSAGKGFDYKKSLPSNVTVVEFVNQYEVLHEAQIFITRGGMASVHESLYNLTPMIVIPEIPEQVVTAGIIQELGVGLHLPRHEFNQDLLKNSITKIVDNITWYSDNISKLLARTTEVPAGLQAANLIKDKLKF